MRVVADDRQPPAVRFQRSEYPRLQQVGVLVFVDENVIERSADFAGKVLFADQVTPVQQQVVVIERLGCLLAHNVMTEERTQFLLPLGAPWVCVLQCLLELLLRIDASRIDGEAGVFLRKTARFLRQPEFVTHDIHQVGCVAAIQNRESRVKAEIAGEPPQQAVTDRVERAGPGQNTGRQ